MATWQKAEKVITRALDELGRLVQVHLHDGITAGTPVRTGRLKRSMTLGSGSEDQQLRHTVEKAKIDHTLTTTVPYAKFVEYGTIKMRPRSMIRNATSRAREIVLAAAREWRVPKR